MTTSNVLKHQLTPEMLLCQSEAEEIQTHKPITWFQSPQSQFLSIVAMKKRSTIIH